MKMTNFTHRHAVKYPDYNPHNSKISVNTVVVYLGGIKYEGSIIAHSQFHVDICLMCNRKVDPTNPLLHKYMTIQLECMAQSFTSDICEEMPFQPSIEYLFLRGFRIV